ncbi:MAG: hypothetical protein ACP6KW_01325 [Candidatus Thorarchaeota archaeon]
MRWSLSSLRVMLTDLIKRHLVLIVILVVGGVVWNLVFTQATIDFLQGGARPFRASWIGIGDFNLFGLTIHYDFEGWSDYDYYYLSWGENFLNGIMPYTDEFNSIVIDSTKFETPYFLPPLFVYLCAAGTYLSSSPFGVGFLITAFGFLTAVPVYGSAAALSNNPRVGHIAALTYLFNPVVLYYTAYQWLNPAPFVFFMMLSFNLLITRHRTSGVLAMAASALMKQIAFFLAIPMVAYLIKRPPRPDDDGPVMDEKGRLVSDSLDIRSLIKASVQVLLFVGALSYPYLLDPSNYLYYILQRPGATLLEDVTVLPDTNLPVTFVVLFILVGAPEWLAQLVNLATFYSVLLIVGVCAALLLMLFEVKDDRDLAGYWRRMLFYTLLLLLWVHLFSPRGIYKYYCVALIPLFCILSTHSMLTKGTEKVQPSLFMVINPFLISIAIMLPSRYVYLSLLLIIMLSYILHKQFAIVHGLLNRASRQLVGRLRAGITGAIRRSEVP